MRYAVVDTETTGVGKGVNGRIVQLGIVVVEDGRVVDRLNTFVDPTHHGRGYIYVPKQAEAVHGISGGKLAYMRRHGRAPTMKQLKPVIREKLRGCRVVTGHNLAFDERMMKQNGVPLPSSARHVDTMHLAHQAGHGRCKLVDLAKKVGISTRGMRLHSAYDDALLTSRVYDRLRKKLRT